MARRNGEPWLCNCLDWRDVLALAPDDLTYRQLNHWTTTLGIVTGYYHAHHGKHLTSADMAERGGRIGTGYSIGWALRDARRAALAARVLAATTSGGAHLPVELAFRLADGPVVLDLGGEPYCLSLAPMLAVID